MAFKTILRGRMLEMRNRLLPSLRELLSYLVPKIPSYFGNCLRVLTNYQDSILASLRWEVEIFFYPLAQASR